jgi:hypothetical protein
MDRTHVANILPKRLEEYMREAEHDLKLTEMNIKEKAMLRSSFGAKYLRYTFEEERFKKKLEADIEKLKEVIKDEYLKENTAMLKAENPNIEKLLNFNIEKKLKTDERYLKYKEAIEAQNEIIRLLYEIQKLIASMNFDIKNSTDILKMESI